MRPKPRRLRWAEGASVCVCMCVCMCTSCLMYSHRAGASAEGTSFCLKKPALATCKWSAMTCEISTGCPDASLHPFSICSRRACILSERLCSQERKRGRCESTHALAWLLRQTDAVCRKHSNTRQPFPVRTDGQSHGRLSRAKPGRANPSCSPRTSAELRLPVQVLPYRSN